MCALLLFKLSTCNWTEHLSTAVELSRLAVRLKNMSSICCSPPIRNWWGERSVSIILNTQRHKHTIHPTSNTKCIVGQCFSPVFFSFNSVFLACFFILPSDYFYISCSPPEATLPHSFSLFYLSILSHLFSVSVWYVCHFSDTHTNEYCTIAYTVYFDKDIGISAKFH